MNAGTERVVKIGFPVSAPGGRLRAFGEAVAAAPGALEGDAEAQLARAIAAALGASLSRAAARRSGFAEAVAEAEARLRAAPPLPGVAAVTIRSLVITGDDGGELYSHRASGPPATPVALCAGSAVMASWQGQWFPARIVEITGDQAKLVWEGNDAIAWAPLAHLRPRT